LIYEQLSFSGGKTDCLLSICGGGKKVWIGYVVGGRKKVIIFDIPKDVMKKIGKDFGF